MIYLYIYIVASVLAVYGAHKLDERAERRRSQRAFEQSNRRTGIHPADDLHLSDSWPEFEKWKDGKQ